MLSNGIKSYKQHTPHTHYDAIIIGSGMSGLTCASILAQDGKRVLVLEKHYTAGGFTHIFKRKGYEWDVGLHYVGQVMHPTAMLTYLFDYICDGQLKWADMGDIYDSIFFGKQRFDYYKNQTRFIEHLKELFPAPSDQKAIDQYFKLLNEVNEASNHFFAEKILSPETSAQVREKMRQPFLAFAEKNTYQALKEITQNDKLIGVLTGQYGDYGTTPKESSFAVHALIMGHYLHGGAYPVGGSSQIVKIIADILAKRDSLILVRATVDKVIVENGEAIGVQMIDGKKIFAPLVISSIGIQNSYNHLLPSADQERIPFAQKVSNMKPSTGHLALYVGFKESAQALGLQKSNYWIFPEGQYDHDQNMARYLEDPSQEFPFVFVSFPSAKDPNWESRYPDRATIDIITAAAYDWFAEWEDQKWRKRGDMYEKVKEDFSQRLLEVLFKYEPQLREKVDYYELSTPLSTKVFTNYRVGEMYGVDHTQERFLHDFMRPHTPIKNLFLTGQDITTCGISSALLAGVLTVSAITGKNYQAKIRQQVLQERRNKLQSSPQKKKRRARVRR